MLRQMQSASRTHSEALRANRLPRWSKRVDARESDAGECSVIDLCDASDNALVRINVLRPGSGRVGHQRDRTAIVTHRYQHRAERIKPLRAGTRTTIYLAHLCDSSSCRVWGMVVDRRMSLGEVVLVHIRAQECFGCVDHCESDGEGLPSITVDGGVTR